MSAKRETRSRPDLVRGDFLTDPCAVDLPQCPVCAFYGVRKPEPVLPRFGHEKRVETLDGRTAAERTIAVCSACRNRLYLRRWTDRDGRRRLWVGWDDSIPTD